MKFKRATQRGIVFLLLALEAVASQACRVAPAGQLITIDEQVRQATDVAVGQVISATPLGGGDVEFRFLVLDQLAGQVRKVFTVTGRAGERDGNDAAFNDHTDFAFWACGGGRVMIGTDCAIYPNFVVGSSYLVFLGTPSTRRSFEEIGMVNGTVNQDDKWLVYVKEQLAKRQGSDMATTAVTQDTTANYERVGRFIYSFYRIVSRDELDRKTLAGQQAPNELILRAGTLADEFDRIAASSSALDAELKATLREAVAVSKALAAWRESTGAVPLAN